MDALLPIIPPKIFSQRDWQRCFEDWLASVYMQRRKPTCKTTYNYALIIKRLYTEYAPGKTPEDLETHDLLQYIRREKKWGGALSASKQNQDLAVIKSFHSFAKNYGVLKYKKQRAIFAGIDNAKKIKPVEAETDRRAFDEDEIPRFFRVINRDTLIGKRDYAIFWFLFSTGRRISEVINLRWEDVQIMALEDGSRGPAYRWIGKRKVSRSPWRQLDRSVWDAIIDYLKATKRLEKIKPEHAIFCSNQSQWQQEPIGYFAVYFRFRKYMALAGLQDDAGSADLTIHSWRATYAVESYEGNGHDLDETMRELDHASVEMTLKYIQKGRRKAKKNTASERIREKYYNLS